MDTIAQVAAAMREILTSTANTLARTSGFVQRTSKLTGAGFVQAWVFACMASPMPTWEDVSQSAATVGVRITAQGLADRCGESAATLLKEVLQASIQQVIAAEPVAIPLLNRFSSVFIEDSSTIVLPPVLAETWRGCGGTTAHGNAALKVQVRLDLCHGTLRGPALQDGRAADQRSPLHDELLVAKALYLADLGYWSLLRFARIAAAGAFWLSRYQPQTVLFTADGSRWDDVRGLLEAQGTDQVDLPVTVGVDARVPARLLGVRLPPAVAEQRRQRIIADARADGKPVSGDLLHLAAWTIFLTNAPVELLSLREALVIGRARWQIELLFKLWKSHGHVDESRGAQPWRVLCEVYAKLLAVLISHWVMLTELWAYPDRSLVKAAQLIQKHAFHLASSLWSQRALEDALNVIRDGLRACCRMNARQEHPNTYQMLMNPELSFLA
jgi:hypothetical protein